MTAPTGVPAAMRFPGQWYQAETGLYQNWMRDYDPTTGRYIQADPLGLVDGASVYGYARGNPGRWTDRSGLYKVRMRSTNTGGVGYEKGDYYEGSRKQCQYICTREDTNQTMSLILPGVDDINGDYCYGVPTETVSNLNSPTQFSTMPMGDPEEFIYDTDWTKIYKWWNGYGDLDRAVKQHFGVK